MRRSVGTGSICTEPMGTESKLSTLYSPALKDPVLSPEDGSSHSNADKHVPLKGFQTLVDTALENSTSALSNERLVELSNAISTSAW